MGHQQHIRMPTSRAFKSAIGKISPAGGPLLTRDWWQQRRARFACLVSQEVLAEASRGDPDQVRRRLAVLALLPRVAVSSAALESGGADSVGKRTAPLCR